MKLLFDENIAPGLVLALGDVYPESAHVRDCGLKSAPDSMVWSFAAREGYVIVSKDADFRQRSFVLGHPPKVVWIRLGNCSTAQIVELMRHRREEIERFGANADLAFLGLA